MNLINQFGRMVSSESLKDPEKARRLLLMGYRLQEKRLKFFPDKNLPDSAHYVARIVMKNIIHALARPENAAMVSIFVPGELLTAAGLTPYSVEALSNAQLADPSPFRCGNSLELLIAFAFNTF